MRYDYGLKLQPHNLLLFLFIIFIIYLKVIFLHTRVSLVFLCVMTEDPFNAYNLETNKEIWFFCIIF